MSTTPPPATPSATPTTAASAAAAAPSPTPAAPRPPQAPFSTLSSRQLRGLVVASSLLALAYAFALGQQGAPLKALLSHGIVTLELPGDTAGAQRLLAALGEAGRSVARLQVQLDFAFLLLYPLALASTCALIARQGAAALQRTAARIAWAVLLAAPLDATENLALLRLLDGHTAAPWPQLSTLCAALKFALVIAAAACVAAGAAAGLLRLLRR